MSLQDLMNNGLPINRKERFYTGTVFPMLVCQNEFRHFDRFTALIEGYVPQPIDVYPSTANIQFFTEYGLAESIIGNSAKRLVNPPYERDTPDIIILIRGTHSALIAIEAKMFLAPAPTALRRQMTDQRPLLNYLRDILSIDYVYHVALVPKQWQVTLGNFEFPVITWHDLYDQFLTVLPNDYFLTVLGIALDKYDDLVSHRSADGGKNNERKMTGLSIYEGFKAETLTMNIMGRQSGLNGKPIGEDLETGNWQKQIYETSSATELPNPNWFYIEDFIARIDKLNNEFISEIQ